jgi:hypothetical protein
VLCLARTIIPTSLTLFPRISILVKWLMLKARILQESYVILLFRSYMPVTLSFFRLSILSTIYLSVIRLLERRIYLVLESKVTLPIRNCTESLSWVSYLLSFRMFIFCGDCFRYWIYSKGPRRFYVTNLTTYLTFETYYSTLDFSK